MSRKEKFVAGKRKKRSGRLRLLAAVLITGAAAYAAIAYLMPSRERIDPDWQGLAQPVFVQGELTGYAAYGSGEELLLPLPLLQEHVDESIRYEEESQSVILTTESDLLFMQEESTSATLNNEPLQLRLAPEQQEGSTYLPAEPVADLYGLDVYQAPDTGAVLLMRSGESVPLGTVRGETGDKPLAVRAGASIHSPIVADAAAASVVMIWGTAGEGWLRVQTYSGYTGFVKEKEIATAGEKKVEPRESEPTRAERSWADKPVNMFWEAVYERKPNPSSFGPLPGVNVVSPTWFRIVDDDGNVRSQADRAYVEWAHSQDMEVWGLLSNSFDPELTTEALSTYERRMRTIVQMLEYSALYGLDGINIDFENVHTKDGENVTQFMRELKPLAAARNLIVSIDVTPKSNSEMWSVFLDRRALAPLVDFMMVMTYDEHWASSPKSGSVASLPWVEQSVVRILEEDDVPPSKLILGIPLYTRIWTETPEEGKVKVSSKAVSMNAAAQIVSEQELTPEYDASSGQHYVEYEEDGSVKKIWLEDETSLAARVALAQKHRLGGIASWNRTFGNESAWNTLQAISE